MKFFLYCIENSATMSNANHPPADVLVPYPSTGFVPKSSPGRNGRESGKRIGPESVCSDGDGVEGEGDCTLKTELSGSTEGRAGNILIEPQCRMIPSFAVGVFRKPFGKLESIPAHSILFSILCIILPSCVEFQASGGTTAAHYKGPPWGKVAYAKGDEMFTSDHDAGWIATVTAGQNIINTVAGEAIAGNVATSLQHSKDALSASQSANALKAKQAQLAADAAAAKLKAMPTITAPPQVVNFPP